MIPSGLMPFRRTTRTPAIQTFFNGNRFAMVQRPRLAGFSGVLIETG